MAVSLRGCVEEEPERDRHPVGGATFLHLGYKLLCCALFFHVPTLYHNPSDFRKCKKNPRRDFTPIGAVVESLFHTCDSISHFLLYRKRLWVVRSQLRRGNFANIF